MIYWKYLLVVLRHKWYVLLAGLNLRVPIINLLFHDYDKFFPANFITYAKFFIEKNGDKEAFRYSWNNHQKRNKHHWNYWVLIDGVNDFKVLEMPKNDVLEMIADWTSAGVVYGTPLRVWYEQNKEKIMLHPKTRLVVESWIYGVNL